MDASFSAPRDLGSPIESFNSRQRRFAWSRLLTRVGSVARYLVSNGLGRTHSWPDIIFWYSTESIGGVWGMASRVGDEGAEGPVARRGSDRRFGINCAVGRGVLAKDEHTEIYNG